jgi:hypothetical protein
MWPARAPARPAALAWLRTAGGYGSSVPLTPGPGGPLGDGDGAARAAPADGGEPGPGRRDWTRFARRWGGVAPPAEPGPRAARVDPGRRAQVFPEVQQDVDEPSPRLGGRAEVMSVVAAAPHASAPPRRAVDRLRASRRQPLQPADERHGMVAFDEEMDVIALHREMDDAKRRLVGRRERALQDWKDARRPERRQRVARPQRHMHGPSSLMPRAWPMRRARSRRDELPPRARPLAAPPPSRRQLELNPTPPSHGPVVGSARAALRLDRNIAQPRSVFADLWLVIPRVPPRASRARAWVASSLPRSAITRRSSLPRGPAQAPNTRCLGARS